MWGRPERVAFCSRILGTRLPLQSMMPGVVGEVDDAVGVAPDR